MTVERVLEKMENLQVRSMPVNIFKNSKKIK